MQIFATSRHFLHIVRKNKIPCFKGRHNKSRSKKIVGSKNVFNKSSWKFYILSGDFFCFDNISKMRIL